MRRAIVILLLSLQSVAGCQEGEQHAAPAPAFAERDPGPFLIEAAATDFRKHVALAGIDFRQVHLGLIRRADGTTMNLMCGEFRVSGTAKWAPFATIQTDGYENWLGASAASYCQGPNTVLDTSRDLAEGLRHQYNPTK